MAKIGIYGGSFNPIHFGHVGLAEWVIAHTDLDELWLMVTPNNPLKPASLLAPEEERLRAAQEAVRAIPGVRVSDFEFHLPRPSYTANTLRALEQAYPEPSTSTNTPRYRPFAHAMHTPNRKLWCVSKRRVTKRF